MVRRNQGRFSRLIFHRELLDVGKRQKRDRPVSGCTKDYHEGVRLAGRIAQLHTHAERNALRAGSVRRAEDWQYGCLWRWLQKPEPEPEPRLETDLAVAGRSDAELDRAGESAAERERTHRPCGVVSGAAGRLVLTPGCGSTPS